MTEINITEDQHEKYYVYLDNLRESGITNMYGAVPYLKKAFKIKEDIATTILSNWMRSFPTRHPESK